MNANATLDLEDIRSMDTKLSRIEIQYRKAVWLHRIYFNLTVILVSIVCVISALELLSFVPSVYFASIPGGIALPAIVIGVSFSAAWLLNLNVPKESKLRRREQVINSKIVLFSSALEPKFPQHIEYHYYQVAPSTPKNISEFDWYRSYLETNPEPSKEGSDL